VIRLFIPPWWAFVFTSFLCIATLGQENAQPHLSFSLFAWSGQSPKSPKPSTGKVDPVRYLPEFQYRDGNETHSVTLFPGRQSNRLRFAGESPLALYRALPENNATEIAAVLHFDPRWRDVLFVLFPKDISGRSYSGFPIDRTLATQTPGAGVVVNLTREKILVDVNGAKKQLASKDVSPFRMQRPGEDFTRFQVSVQTEDDWTVVHSTKRFLSKRAGTVFLLSPGSSGSSKTRPKVIILSPPR